jgi:hypothetical protein
MKGLF